MKSSFDDSGAFTDSWVSVVVGNGLSSHLSPLFNISFLTTSTRALILPTNNGHPVKRLNYATEVNHGKGSEAGQANP